MAEDDLSWDEIDDSWLRRLAWAVEEIENCTAGPLSPSRLTGANFGAFKVCSAWVRLAHSYARGVLVVLADGLPEAAAPLERSLWELWAEMVYLLNHGAPADNAARVEVSATMDLADFLRRTAPSATDALAGVERALGRLRAEHPGAYAAIAAQRSAQRKQWHWSGLNRNALWRKVMGRDGPALYGLMSWEAHGIITPIRDVRADLGEGALVFAPSEVQSREEAIERAAEFTTRRIADFWNRYADEFGVPIINPGDYAPPP